MNIVPQFILSRITHRPNLVKILDNMGWLFFDKVMRMGVSLLVGVWMARYIGPEQFGLFSFASAFVAMFSAVAGLGLQSIVVRDIVRDHACKEETLGTAAVLHLAGSFLAYTCLMGAIYLLRPEDVLAKMLVGILGSLILCKFSDVALYWFESQVLSKYIVWVQNASFIIFAIIKIYLIMSHASLLVFAWAVVAEAFAVAMLMLAMLGLRGPKLKALRFSMRRAKTLLMDSWPLLMSAMAIMVYMKIDLIMLGQMLDDDAVGIYSAAVRISEVWYFIPTMIVASVFPVILDGKNRNQTLYEEHLQSLYDLMVWLSVAIAIPMTFLSTPIVVVLFGATYTESGPVLAIHIWASVFVFLGVASSQWFVIENRQMLSFVRTLLGASINVVLNFMFIPSFGPIGAAVATVFSYAAAAFFSDVLQKETRPMFAMKLKSMNIFASLQRARRRLLTQP